MNRKHRSVGWHFDNSYAQLPEKLFSRLDPVPVSSPQKVLLNERLANPAIIPRNHKVEEALQVTVWKENLTPLQKLLELLSQPYSYVNNPLYQMPPVGGDQDYQTFCGT